MLELGTCLTSLRTVQGCAEKITEMLEENYSALVIHFVIYLSGFILLQLLVLCSAALRCCTTPTSQKSQILP